IKFRFIDTAGIRETEDIVESMGIRKTFEKIDQSRIVLYLFDAQRRDFDKRLPLIRKEMLMLKEKAGDRNLILLANKNDEADPYEVEQTFAGENVLQISGRTRKGLDALTDILVK